MSKSDQFVTLSHHLQSSPAQNHFPPFLLLQTEKEMPAAEAFEALGAPLYVKVDGCYARSDDGGTVCAPVRRNFYDQHEVHFACQFEDLSGLRASLR